MKINSRTKAQWLVVLFASFCLQVHSQNVVINEHGTTTTANPSTTVLDLSASTLGFLMPMMTAAQMNAISSPANTLLVYNTSIGCYEFYNSASSQWLPFWCLCTAPPAPLPTISGSTTPCQGSSQVYTISNVASINALNYEWSVPTGCTITAGQGTPSITVTIGSTSGTISVIASNTCGTASAGTLAITITAGSVTAAPTSNSPVCTGGTLNLSAGGSGGTTWTWSGPAAPGPGAGFSTAENPSIVAANTSYGGTYTVTATAGAGCGSSGPQTVVVTVNTTPVVTVSPTSSTICDGGSTTMTASGASTYSWYPATNLNPAAGTSSVETATPPSTITYSVTGTSAAGCTATADATCAITVNPLPTVSGLGPSPALPSCVSANGENITYTVSAAGGTTYTWTPTGGSIVSGQGTASCTVSWTTVGNDVISVYATTTATGCVGPATTYTTNVSSSCTTTYTSCGAGQTFTVPAGITTLTVTVAGASGGMAYGPVAIGNTNGNCYGAAITGKYSTAGGDVLYLNVGCQGGTGSSTAGGASGAGGDGDENGGTGIHEANYTLDGQTPNMSGGGGGGGTDIRYPANTLADRIVVGGGGGGDFYGLYEACSGYTFTYFADVIANPPAAYSCGATSAGNLAGQNGDNCQDQTSADADDGNGAATTAAGAATTGTNWTTTCGNCIWTGGACQPTSGTGGSCAGGTSQAGGVVSQGNGGNASYSELKPNPNTGCILNPGGGGGGGYYGGGGGAGGGGGGGSSYTGGLSSVTSVTASGNWGNGYIYVTW